MKDQRANAGQVGRKDADKRYKCSAFDILKLKDEKKVGEGVESEKGLGTSYQSIVFSERETRFVYEV